MASTDHLLTLISSVSSHYPPIPPPECHWVTQLKPLSVCLEIRFFHAAQAELSIAALSRPANKQLIAGRGRHPKLLANLGVPLEGREAGIRRWHRTVVESQQMEENGRSPVVFHRRGSESRLWNIFSFWVLSVMDYRQPISQAALLPPENFFFFFTFSFSLFFWGGCSSASACLVTSRGFITWSTPPRRLAALAVTALHARGSRTKGLSDELLEFSLRKHPSKAINNWGGVLKFSWRRQDIILLHSFRNQGCTFFFFYSNVKTVIK